MSDIVERLRADLALGLSANLGDTKEAADEIEKLRAALKTARRDAMKKAARVAQSYDQSGDYGAAARHISANILAIMEIGNAVLGEKE